MRRSLLKRVSWKYQLNFEVSTNLLYYRRESIVGFNVTNYENEYHYPLKNLLQYKW